MMFVSEAAEPDRAVYTGILAISVSVLALAYMLEYLGGIRPCVLCLYERVPFFVTATVALAALALRPTARWRRLLTLGCAGVFAASAALGLYHIGIEYGWWAAPAVCSGDIPGADALASLRAPQSAPAMRACDQDVWRAAGLSLAGWNALGSSVLALACVLSGLGMRWTRTGR